MACASIRATTSPFLTTAPEVATLIKISARPASGPRIMGAATEAKVLADVAPVKRRIRWMGPLVTFAVRIDVLWTALLCAFGLAMN